MTYMSSRKFTTHDEKTAVFPAKSRAFFAGNYPEKVHVLEHRLTQHDLLTLDAIAKLGEMLPPESREYNLGDLPIGVDADKVKPNGMGIGDTIRNIDSAASWAVLKNIEQIPEYESLLLGLLGEIRDDIEAATGKMLRPQGFIFVSSPGSMTPYHFDPEHNILLQLRGQKEMTVFPAGDTRFAADEEHESYHTGGGRNLKWSDDYLPGGKPYELNPGQAIYVPVMAPHFVRNGDKPSISLSITWRSEWSFAEADVRAFNALIRKAGLRPKAPARFPEQNRFKANIWRAMRKARLVE